MCGKADSICLNILHCLLKTELMGKLNNINHVLTVMYNISQTMEKTTYYSKNKQNICKFL